MTTSPQRILVATDFSPTSKCALSLATNIARRLEAELHLLYVRQVVDDPGLDKRLFDEVERVLKRGEGNTIERLHRLAQEAVDLPFEVHIERNRSISRAIIEMVGDLGCDLVVMGTHGRAGFKHLLMGSVAEKVMRLSPVPVLTSGESTTSCDDVPKNILVAHDFSEHSIEAVRLAAVWAQLISAKVTLLHAIHPLVYHEIYALDDYSGAVWERIVRRCQDALENIADEYLPGLNHAVAVVENHAVRGITHYASEHRCDLVILATRGLSGLEHAIVGSVAEQVVRLSPVPVLTVR